MYSYSDCSSDIPANHCSNCESPELGRIRSFGVVRLDKLALLLVNPTNPAPWQALINADDGSIFIFPNTQGTFDGGTPKILPGFGNVHQRRVSSEYKVAIKEPDYILNAQHWDAVQDAINYVPFFCSETQVHIADKVASLIPKAPIADDDQAEVVWEAEASWISKRYPVPYDIPAGIFVCA